MEDRPDITSLLDAAARALNRPRTLDATLDEVVATAVQTVPGFDHVSVTLVHRNGKAETRAGSDQLVMELDQVQYDLRDGPCFDALKAEGGIVVCEDMRHEQRWPRYARQALEAGVEAQMGLYLHESEQLVGGLNLYSTERTGLHPDALGIATLFATQAALALGRTRRESHLTQALATRTVIGQALGVVMERYHVDEQRAFDFLARVSSTSNTKLREVAEGIVREVQDQAHGGTEPTE